jgi:hypothetical protein
MPKPAGSLPDQLTGIEVEEVVVGNESTVLIGAVVSIVLITVLVRMRRFAVNSR